MKYILFILLWLPLTVFASQIPAGKIRLTLGTYGQSFVLGSSGLGVATPEVLTTQTAFSDTIYVSDTETTYLLFPDEVLLVDIGRTGDYYAKIEGKSVFLKARTKESGPTNMLIRFGDAYFTARIIFAALPVQSLYDLGKAVAPVAKGVEGETDLKNISTKLMTLQQLPESGPGMKKSRHGISLWLTQLQNDQQAIYMGLKLRNSSSIDYRLDFVGFTFQEKRGKRLSRNNSYRKEVRPYAELAPVLVPAYGEDTLWYALPLYAMTSRGKLQILLREKAGARSIRILVPARKINRAQLLVEGHGN